VKVSLAEEKYGGFSSFLRILSMFVHLPNHREVHPGVRLTLFVSRLKATTAAFLIPLP